MATKQHPGVSVVMPVLNEESHLSDAVASILNQNYPGPMELILALGPSKDATNEIAKELATKDSRLVLLPNPKGLTTVGLNAAIAAAKYDFVVRVDAHSEPAAGYIENGIRILTKQQADLVGGIMAARGRTPFQQAVAWAYTSRFGIGGASYHVGGQAGEAESAYLGIFRKNALTRVGGYDETIIRGEDWDLAQRIKRTGGQVWFSPELSVTYWPRAKAQALGRQFYSTGVWRGDLTRRNTVTASKRYFLPPLLVALIAGGLVQLLLGNQLGILPLAGYLLAVAALATTASGLSIAARLALLRVLPIMHLGWGMGFWFGFVRGAAKTVDRSRMSKDQLK